jgi:hypothetical protein
MVLFLFCLGWQRTPNLDVRRSAAPHPRCLIDRGTVERAGMTEVSVRDLRNHGDAVLDSVMRGESVTVPDDFAGIESLTVVTLNAGP